MPEKPTYEELEQRVRELARSESDRKRTEEALRESEERYRTLVEENPHGVQEIDSDGIIVFANAAHCEMFGYEEAELIGRSAADLLVPGPQRDELPRYLRTLVQDQPAPSLYSQKSLKKGGEVRDVEVSWNYLRDEEGHVRGFLSVLTDATERKQAEAEKAKLESQLHQSQKMESIGRLAGGVAHDFNNLLTGINGYAEIILGDLEPGDPMRNDMEEIKSAGERAAGLTKQLLAFSRKQVIDPRVVRPNEILEHSQRMLRRIIGEDIDLVFGPEKSLGRIKADPSQLDLILVNLAVNARDAMPKEGKLTIETQNVTLDQNFCNSHLDAEPGDYVMLTVTDTGCGMDEETKSKVFEPFFSTKDKDKGTGLGLATVYGTVKQNNGFITVYSEPDTGTIFKVYFPRVMEEATKSTKDKVSDLPTGTETILVVEDAVMVRRLAKRILEKQGYNVVEAESGGQAFIYCNEHDDPIDLLLTDVVMPGMNGRDLHNTLLEKRPGLKAIFMSGYTENVIAHRGVLDEGVSFIQKPFTIDSLARMARKILDS